MSTGFAVWITGLPASGKSTVSKALAERLDGLGIKVVILESDEMRRILTPEPTYGPKERDRFYTMLAQLGELLVRNGVNIIFDATASRRMYRDRARTLIGRFIEVYIDCPLEICMKRDPKGIYARAVSGEATTVPGIQSEYEPPARPEAVIDCLVPAPRAVESIIRILKEFQYI